nr:LysR family transcriptional regulator [uncultured Holophaga sp.]
METRQLRCFLEVAEQLNFTRAAKHLFLTHSAVGYQVAALEEELGARLFDRNSHSVKLTPAGVYFRTQVQRILAEYAAVAAMTQRIGSGVAGQLRLGFLGGSEERFLPLVLRRFRRTYPLVEVQPSHHALAQLRDGLVQGTLDLAFTHTLTVADLPGLRIWPLSESPLGVVLSREHPLAHRKRLRLGDLKGELFVQLSSAVATAALESHRRLFAKAGFEPRIVQWAGDFGALFLLLEADVGLTILPRYKVKLKDHPHLRYIPLQDEGARLESCIAWQAQSDNPVLALFLRELGVRPLS